MRSIFLIILSLLMFSTSWQPKDAYADALLELAEKQPEIFDAPSRQSKHRVMTDQAFGVVLLIL